MSACSTAQTQKKGGKTAVKRLKSCVCRNGERIKIVNKTPGSHISEDLAATKAVSLSDPETPCA